jgi:hypothetical protein
MSVTLPATTNAFQAANIYARASGYITERNVDIGSHVKTEGVGSGGQCHAHCCVACPHRGDTHIRNELVVLLRDDSDFDVPCVMPPDAKRECAEQQQERAEAEQPAPGGAAAAIALAGRPMSISALLRMLDYAMVAIGHLELLRKDALRGLAVVAFAQHREKVGDP